MTKANSKIDIADMQKRLKAVLSYDGVAENEMYLHLAKVLQVQIL